MCADKRGVWTLVGVVSWGPIDPANGISCMGYSVYAQVDNYLEWIDARMNDSSGLSQKDQRP